MSSKLQGGLTVERVRTSGGWPKLRAKAAATRHLANFALELVREFGRAEDRKVLAVCQLLCRFYDILNAEPMFVSDEILELGRRFGALYLALSREAAEAREKMWKATPKHHLFVHLCEWQSVESGNPRFYWAYADEDLVRLLVNVAKTCHPATMAPSALFKWTHVYFGD